MKNTLTCLIFAIAALLFVSAAPVQAHDNHCHYYGHGHYWHGGWYGHYRGAYYRGGPYWRGGPYYHAAYYRPGVYVGGPYYGWRRPYWGPHVSIGFRF